MAAQDIGEILGCLEPRQMCTRASHAGGFLAMWSYEST